MERNWNDRRNREGYCESSASSLFNLIPCLGPFRAIFSRFSNLHPSIEKHFALSVWKNLSSIIKCITNISSKKEHFIMVIKIFHSLFIILNTLIASRFWRVSEPFFDIPFNFAIKIIIFCFLCIVELREWNLSAVRCLVLGNREESISHVPGTRHLVIIENWDLQIYYLEWFCL